MKRIEEKRIGYEEKMTFLILTDTDFSLRMDEQLNRKKAPIFCLMLSSVFVYPFLISFLAFYMCYIIKI